MVELIDWSLISFICEPCKEAGNWADPSAKATYHQNCKGGTWCDCQHRVGKKNTE